ncbi:MAG: anaerobic glycerol-3-phosphate dehydrogenase subunit A [Betaproteobacteria bacterium]|nr:MAG: anaerobic glycerol-3-phosphate dehydrogenase subunit A [Betaproteobacteria bacterium]
MQTQVLIIGGGVTGTALARDLALRGVDCILVEKDDINAGASGRNHGLLHSGARYAAGDRAAAMECRAEGAILKRMAAQTIQDTGGYFVAVQGDDERYIADFSSHCERSGISTRAVEVAAARALEPALSERAIAVFEVPDASIDPFRLSLENMAHARSLGARLMRRSRVVGFAREGRQIRAVRVRSGAEEVRIEAAQVVNAAGAWAREVALLAGAPFGMTYSKGTLLVTHTRLARRVVNRLRPPSNADIMMPGGTVSIVGTTSTRVDALDDMHPTAAEVDLIVEEAARMLPALATMRFIRAYAGVRPLVAAPGVADGRTVSRGYALFDHEDHGLDNFATITGGKLTTCRLMAERAADLVCRRLGVTRPCLTATMPLPVAAECEWTEPGRSPRMWMRSHGLEDTLLCECEMVSGSAVDAIYDALRSAGDTPTLTDIGLRSRVGKGACQGAFCAVRTVAHLYQRGDFQARRGIDEILDFFGERWRGQRAVLWGEQLAQAELMEALHCGVFGEELRGEESRAAPDADPAGEVSP